MTVRQADSYCGSSSIKGFRVALLDWGPSCWKLADRETYIGWTGQQRAERLGLIVQNRRFLVLGKERMPNLASRSLGLALKALPEHWQAAHGYRPLMAETFTDIERFKGTCDKATNWKPWDNQRLRTTQN